MVEAADSMGDATGMPPLLRALRSWNPWRRRRAACSLAIKGTPEAIAALIGMASGDKRSLFFSYNLQDQLVAVKCLGKTRRPEALEFLENVYSSVKFTERQSYETPYGLLIMSQLRIISSTTHILRRPKDFGRYWIFASRRELILADRLYLRERSMQLCVMPLRSCALIWEPPHSKIEYGPHNPSMHWNTGRGLT